MDNKQIAKEVIEALGGREMLTVLLTVRLVYV